MALIMLMEGADASMSMFRTLSVVLLLATVALAGCWGGSSASSDLPMP